MKRKIIMSQIFFGQVSRIAAAIRCSNVTEEEISRCPGVEHSSREVSSLLVTLGRIAFQAIDKRCFGGSETATALTTSAKGFSHSGVICMTVPLCVIMCVIMCSRVVSEITSRVIGVSFSRNRLAFARPGGMVFKVVVFHAGVQGGDEWRHDLMLDDFAFGVEDLIHYLFRAAACSHKSICGSAGIALAAFEL
jgi:hypothetical protein